MALLQKKYKLTSVNRLLILSIVPDIKETYENTDLLFKMSNVNNISFQFLADFKLLLIINGQQTATSSYPCPFCFIPLKYLRKSIDSNHNNDSDKSNSRNDNVNEPDNEDYDDDEQHFLKLKTYGDLKKDYMKFIAQGKNKKLAKDANSTINPPLFEEDDDTKVLDKCVVPPLHLMQGFVNHLFGMDLCRF